MDADSARRSDNSLQNPAPTTQPAWFLGLAAGLLALAAAMFGALEVHQSGDTWISLAAGRQIAELGHVPTTDSFSYTFDGQPWINQNWLSHAGYWWLYEHVAPSATVYVTKATEAGVFTDGSVGGAGNMVKSAIDAVAHIPPRNEAKMRTMIRLWSDSSGTGNVLYSGWADEIVSFSLAPYTFI